MNELLDLKVEICHLDLKENTIANLLTSANKVQEEIERLNNIINSLEQEMNEELKTESSGEDFWRGYDDCLKDILNKLKALKGSDTSER